jgi:GR25 family glycosyltransferase involved in LPS biosynthesis
MTDIKIFVLHYTKLVDRKASILKQFQEQGITNFEFVELYDKDSLTPTHLEKFEQNLKPSEISLFLKHIYVYQQIASHYDEALILEDDAILAKNFLSTLNTYRQQLPPDYNLLFIGNGCGLHVPKEIQKEGQNIYERGVDFKSWGGNGASKCTDSYMINKACARRFSSHFTVVETKTPYQIDHWINETARLLRPKVFWAEPTIVTQGSENQTFQKVCGVDAPLAYLRFFQNPK